MHAHRAAPHVNTTRRRYAYASRTPYLVRFRCCWFARALRSLPGARALRLVHFTVRAHLGSPFPLQFWIAVCYTAYAFRITVRTLRALPAARLLAPVPHVRARHFRSFRLWFYWFCVLRGRATAHILVCLPRLRRCTGSAVLVCRGFRSAPGSHARHGCARYLLVTWFYAPPLLRCTVYPLHTFTVKVGCRRFVYRRLRSVCAWLPLCSPLPTAPATSCRVALQRSRGRFLRAIPFTADMAPQFTVAFTGSRPQFCVRA